MKTIKILCICDYGQVRSGALAWHIHGLNRDEEIGRINTLRYEAIQIGSVTSSKKTLKLLKNWADIVVDVRKYIKSDIYGNPDHPELQEIVRKVWEDVIAKKVIELEESNENNRN